MGGCRCSYKNCKSATKTKENLHFFHYPVKHRDRCAVWIKNAEKPEFAELPDDQLRNKVICGLHFEDKFFTNEIRRRLVHDAVPTLDEGCEMEVAPFPKEVEVFPTSIDGTTFTLQADNLQPGPSRNAEQKFGFRNGKMIIHNFDNTESEVYTINPSYIQQSFFNPNEAKEIFITPSNFQTDSNDSAIVYRTINNFKEGDIVYESSDLLRDTLQGDDMDYITPDDPKVIHNLFFDVEAEQPTKEQIIEEKKVEKFERSPKNKKYANRSVLKRINLHAQEIANIKRSMAQSNVKLHRNGIIRMLKGRVPDTLLGALSLHLQKRQNNLTTEEKSFLHAMNSISPSAFNVLRDFGWYIPQDIVLDDDTEGS